MSNFTSFRGSERRFLSHKYATDCIMSVKIFPSKRAANVSTLGSGYNLGVDLMRDVVKMLNCTCG